MKRFLALTVASVLLLTVPASAHHGNGQGQGHGHGRYKKTCVNVENNVCPYNEDGTCHGYYVENHHGGGYYHQYAEHGDWCIQQ